MKKGFITAALSVAVMAFVITGCSTSSKIDTDELELTGYKGIEIDKVDDAQKVTDDDVNTQIDQTRESKATTKEVTDRAVKDGDIATIDFVGKMDGKEFDGGSATDYQLEIGSDSFIDGFEDSIIGHKIGDKFDWKGKFPDDYSSTDLAGKDVTFTITVKGISEKTLPELNDAFVKEVSKDSKTVKEYKEEVKKDLEKQAKLSHDDSLYGAVLDAVVAKAKVKKYDDDDIKKQVDEQMESYKSEAESAGMDFDSYAQQYGISDEAAFRTELEKMIKDSAKEEIVINAIAKKEKINPTDKEYDELYKYIADAQGSTVDDLTKTYGEDTVKSAAKRLAVMQWLADNCVQVEK